MLSIGIPVMLQDGFIQVSFMIITIIANQRGLTDAAAVGIVEKIISFLFLVPSSLLSTVSALGAQNIGAGKHERVDAILRYAIGIGLGFGGVMALLMQFIAPSVVRPFTAEEAVVLAGASYLRGYIFDCMFAGGAVQLQRLFLRLRKVRAVLFAQHPVYPAGACAGGISGFPVFPADSAAHGPCFGGRLAVFQRGLRRVLPLAQTPSEYAGIRIPELNLPQKKALLPRSKR